MRHIPYIRILVILGCILVPASKLVTQLTMYSSYSVAAVVCSVVFPVLASSAVAMRFWARKIKNLAYSWDDYLITVALVGTISL